MSTPPDTGQGTTGGYGRATELVPGIGKAAEGAEITPATVRAEATPAVEKPEATPAAEIPGSPGTGEEAFRSTAARIDLEQAQQEVKRNIEDLNGLSASNKDLAAEVMTETRTLSGLLGEIHELLSRGQEVPPGLAVSVTVRVELVQDAAMQAGEHADTELKGVLKQVLERTPKVGRKLLSMNLHLFPVKEWKLGGAVNAGFAKGTIEVTFGRGT